MKPLITLLPFFLVLLASCSSRTDVYKCEDLYLKKVLVQPFSKPEYRLSGIIFKGNESQLLPEGNINCTVSLWLDSVSVDLEFIKAVDPSKKYTDLVFHLSDLRQVHVYRHDADNADESYENTTAAGKTHVLGIYNRYFSYMAAHANVFLEIYSPYFSNEWLPEVGEDYSDPQLFLQSFHYDDREDRVRCNPFIRLTENTYNRLRKRKMIRLGDTICLSCGVAAGYRKTTVRTWEDMDITVGVK